MATGGDITEITYNHPTLGTGTFYPKSNEDSTFDEGGIRSQDDMNMVAGNGEMIDSLTRSRWSFEAKLAWDMNTREDLLKLRTLAASPVLADWTITSINGTVWGGKGKPVGDLKGAGKEATLPLKLSGSGVLKKIVG